MDYHLLNAITKKDSYHLPLIEDLFRVLGGSKCFYAMYLASGYCQVNLSPANRKKCALISRKGLFDYTQILQGLYKAPATIQRAMYFYWEI